MGFTRPFLTSSSDRLIEFYARFKLILGCDYYAEECGKAMVSALFYLLHVLDFIET